MSDELFFDGARYISAAGAADVSNLTRDYVARLAREGKVVGRQVGRQWYVSHESLRTFLVAQEYANSQRRGALVRERQQEYGRVQAPAPEGKKINASSAMQKASVATPATPMVSNDLHRKLSEAAMRTSTQAVTKATTLAGNASAQIPLYAISPSVELLHKIAAAVLALALVVGMYSAGGSLIMTSPQFVPGTTLTPQTELTAAAGSIGDVFGNVASALTEGADALLAPFYGVHLAANNSGSGVVAVKISAINPTAPSPFESHSVSETVVENPVVERVVQSEQILSSGGITESELDQKLQQLQNALTNQIANSTAANSTVIAQNYNVTAQTNAIDQLYGTTITNPSISGGSISNTNISGGTISGATFAGTTTLDQLAVSGSATSTFAGSIDLAGGCFAVDGTCIGTGGAGNPGGSNTEVQFNQNGVAFAGSPGFTFSSASDTLSVINASTTNATSTTFFASVANFTTAITSSLSATFASITGLTVTNATTTNATTTNLYVSGNIGLGNALPVSSGGTGTSTAPSYGQLLVGNGAGGFDLVATSSLGITGSGGSGSSNVSTSSQNIWSALQVFAANASTSEFTATSSVYFTSITNSLLSTNASGQVVATTSIGSNLISVPANALLAGNSSGQLVATTSIGTDLLTGTLGVGNGGTGIASTPSLGTILVGNGTNYALTATSSLGLPTFSNVLASIASAYPFALTGNATSTLTQFNGGLTAFASSTIGNGGVNGLTVNGNATTTGNVSIGGALTLKGATTTASNGFNISAGCFSVNGTCITGSGGSSASSTLLTDNNTWTGLESFAKASSTLTTLGTTWFSGINNALLSTNASGQVVATTSIGVNYLSGILPIANGGTATSTQVTNGINYFNGSYITSNANLNFNGTDLGIGTTSPYATLGVGGNVAASYYNADNAAATSTFAGGLTVGNGALNYDYSSGVTSIQNLELGALTFDTDAGQVSWADLPVSSSPSQGTIESYTAQIGGNPDLTVYGEADGSGGVQNLRVGVGTTTPGTTFAVQGTTGDILNVASSTGTSLFYVAASGNVGIGTTTPGSILSINGVGNFVASATSTLYDGLNITSGCFSINGTCVGSGSGSSNVSTSTQNIWSALQVFAANASTSQFTATSSVYFTSLTNDLLSTNASGQVVATTSIGTNYLTGTLGTINGTAFTVGGSITVASTTLLSNNNTWTGLQSFANSSSTLATITTGWATNFNATYASSTALTVSGNTYLNTVNVTGNTTLANATSTNFFSTTASSTNLFAQTASLGSLTLGTALTVGNGGTGINSTPAYGNILVGNGTNYTLTATSSLGLQSPILGTKGQVAYFSGTNSPVGTSSLAISSQGFVGIGTTTPIDELQVAGLANPIEASSTNSLSSPRSVYVQGRYAYVAVQGGSMDIFDISNSTAAPVNVGTLFLSQATYVYVQGRYAYIIDNATLVIADVSNPASPVQIGSISGLSNAASVYVQGRYAYVVGTTGISVIDVSNPASPIQVGSTKAGLNSPDSVYVQGRYAYVSDDGNNSLIVFDISNPASLVKVGSTTTGLSSPNTVYVQGRYAYVADSGNGLVIFDISNPASPTKVGSAAGGATDAFVSGRYAYVTAGSATSQFEVYDISNPASPVKIGFTTSGLSTPLSVYVQGRYAYVVDSGNGSLTTFNIGGEYTQSLEAGTLQAGSLSLDNNLQALDGAFSGGLTVGNNLNVGGSFALTASTFNATTTASSTYSIFSVGSASSTNPFLNILYNGELGIATSSPNPNVGFAVGTTTYFGSNVGIGTTTPGSILSINGVGNFVNGATSTLYNALALGSTLNVTGETTLGNASTTALSVSGNSYLGTSQASAFAINSILSCTGSEALQTDGSGNLSCGLISIGGASSGGGWTTNNIGRVSLATSTNLVAIGATTTPYAKLTVISGAAATTTLALVPASGQTANIIDIYNTSGNLGSVLTAGGNLGIGTTTPGATLSAGGNILGSGTLALTGTTGTTTIASGQGFTIGGSQFLVQQGSGNVGIGTSSPSASLSVTGVSGPSNVFSVFGAANTSQGVYLQGGGGSSFNGVGGNVQIYGGNTNFSGSGTGGNVFIDAGSGFIEGNVYLLSNAAGTRNGQRVFVGSNGTSPTSPIGLFNVIGNASVGYSGSGGENPPTNGLLVNGQTGIGTTTPWGYLSASSTSAFPALSVEQHSTGAAAVFLGGNVGIGTTTPGSILSINGVGNFVASATSTLYDGLNITSGCFSINGTCVGSGSGSSNVSTSTQNIWSALQVFAANASTSQFTATSSVYFTSLTNDLLSTNASGQVVATTSIGTNYLTGTLGTINGTAFTVGGSITVASTTLLSNNNTWTGLQSFANSSSTLATITTGWATNFNATYASSTALTVSGNTYLNTVNVTGNTTLANATSTNFFSTTASSTNLFSQLASFGTLTLPNLTNALLSTNASGQVVATTSVGINYLTGILPIANGGTNASSQTTNGVNFFNGTNITSGSNLTFNGTNLGIGTTSPYALLSLTASNSTGDQSLFQIASSTFSGTGTTTLLNFSSSGQLTIGPNISAVSTSTQLSVLAGTTTIARIASGTLNQFGFGVYVQGRYAYLADNNTTNSFEIWDVSNPTSPVRVSQSTLAQSGFGVYVQGRYAYFADQGTTNAFEIWDVSNPAAPVRVSQSTLNSSGGAVYVQGSYAYIVDTGTTNSFEVWDVSNPAAPVRVSQSTLNHNGSRISVQGSYAYIVDTGTTNSFEVWDVSNPAAPVRVSQSTLNSIGGNLYVQGRYAYLVDSNTTNSFEVWDVSNPAAPVRVSQSTLNKSGGSISVQGRYAYIAGQGTTNAFEVWDVSNPAAPVRVSQNTLNVSGIGLYVQGRYAYFVDQSGTTNAFEVWDLGGAYIQQLETGGLETGSLSVRNNLAAVDAAFSGGVNVGSSLNVTGSASISGSASTTNTTASIFNISTASSSIPIFTALGNGNIGVGTSTPWGLFSLAPTTAASTSPQFVSWVTGSSTPSFIIGSANQNGNIGIGTTTPGTIFSVNNILNLTSGTSTLYTNLSAATTSVNALFVTNTSTSTFAGGINIASGCVAQGGVCLPTFTNLAAAYPFALTGNATSTLTQFNGGLTAYATSTIGSGTQIGGLTVNGGATTTQNLSVLGTGTSTFAGNISITGNIVPTASSTYALGSSVFPWASVYIGPGSLFVNGEEVVHTDPSQNVILSANNNENIEVFGTGTSNIEFNPSGSGNIQLQGPTQITGGEAFTTSNGTPVLFTNGTEPGNLELTGNAISAVNTNGGISISPNGNGGTYVTNGNVGIGTTNPLSKLEVEGNVTATYFNATSSTASTFTGGFVSQASSTVTGVFNATGGASTTNLTVSGNTWLSGLTASSILALDNNGKLIATSTIGSSLISVPANSLLAGNSSGQLVATTSIGTNLLTGTLGTINGTAFSVGGSITVASTTLLANNNTFSGTNSFTGNTTFANATSTNFFSTTASSTNLFAQTASLGSLSLGTALTVGNGGTGINTTPSFGQLLVGNGTNYTLTATSSLGLPTFANLASTYPFTVTGNATSTLTQFNGGLTAFASSTIGNGTQKGGLTISGGATTTGNTYFAGINTLPGLSVLGNATTSNQEITQALTFTGNRTYAGASSPSNSFIFMPGSALFGTATPAADGIISPFNLLISGDNVNTTDQGNGTLYGFSVEHNTSAGLTGSRAAIQGYLSVIGTPVATTAQQNFVGGEFLTGGGASLNGTSGSYTNAHGNYFGLNANVFLSSGATNVQLVNAQENDVTIPTGASAAEKHGLSIVEGSNDANRGVYDDSGIEFANQDNAAATWQYGISFGAYAHQWAFGTDSTLIGAQTRQVGPASSDVALNGVDFRNVTFSSGGYAFASPNFGVNNLGGVTAYASSTIGNGNQNGGLSVNGGATTTGESLFVSPSTASGIFDLLQIKGIPSAGASPDLDFNNGAGVDVLRLGSVANTGESWLDSYAGLHFGTGNSVFGSSERLTITSGGNVGVGTTTPGSIFSVNNILNLTSGTSTLYTNFSAATTSINNLTVSNTSTSTFAGGINLSSGCFSISGTCLGGSSGSGTVNSGTTGQFAFYNANGTTVSGTSTLFITPTGNIGFGTTTPGEVSGANKYLTIASSGSNTSPALELAGNTTAFQGSVGAINFFDQTGSDPDAQISAIIAHDTSLGSLVFSTGAFGTLTQQAVIDSSGDFGVGTTTPGSIFSVQGVGNFVASATSTFYDGINITSGCFSVNGTCVGSGSSLTGTTGQVPYFTGTNTAAGTSTLFISTAGNVGIGTTSPFANLSVQTATNGTAFAIDNSVGSTTFQFSTVNTANNLFEVATSTGLAYFDITAGGNVGIGTTSPLSTFGVVGSACFSKGATASVACGTIAGDAYGSAFNAGAYDVAENYVTSDASATPGTIIGLDPANAEQVITATTSTNILGVVSTNPGLILGGADAAAVGENVVPVALSGRVPVKVNLQGGPIAIGDPITLSSIAGIGTKATTTEWTVGTALQPLTSTGTSTTGTIDVFIKPALTFGSSDLALVSGLASSTATTSPATVASSFFSGASQTLQNDITALGSAVVHVFQDAVYAGTGIFNKIYAQEVHTDELCVSDSTGETCITRTQLEALLANAGASQSGGSGSSSSGQSGSGSSGSGSTSTSSAPVLEVNGDDPATIDVGATYSDLGAQITAPIGDLNLGITASVDGATSTPVADITVDTSAPGTHIITYSATDQNGLTGTATRTVNVVAPQSSGDATSTDSSDSSSSATSSDATSTTP